MSATWLKLPLESQALQTVHAGQWINLTGPLFTARDAALKRICELLSEGKHPPLDLKGQTLYFVGPTPAAPGEPVGAAGPTTSQRMEKYLPVLLKAGVMAVIGKGPMTPGILAEFQRQGAVYFSAAGGAGAFYGSKIRGAAVVAYSDLGPEAVYALQVNDFPVVVAFDLQGMDLFAQGPQSYRKE